MLRPIAEGTKMPIGRSNQYKRAREKVEANACQFEELKQEGKDCHFTNLITQRLILHQIKQAVSV